MVMDYRLDNKRITVQFSAWTIDFPLHCSILTHLKAHPASHSMQMGALFLAVQQLQHEADHSSQLSARVKKCVELYFHSLMQLHDVYKDKCTHNLIILYFSTSVPCLNNSV